MIISFYLNFYIGEFVLDTVCLKCLDPFFIVSNIYKMDKDFSDGITPIR